MPERAASVLGGDGVAACGGSPCQLGSEGGVPDCHCEGAQLPQQSPAEAGANAQRIDLVLGGWRLLAPLGSH